MLYFWYGQLASGIELKSTYLRSDWNLGEFNSRMNWWSLFGNWRFMKSWKMKIYFAWQEAEAGSADRSATLNECVYREDSTVILELTTRSMMEVRDFLFLWIINSSFVNDISKLVWIIWGAHKRRQSLLYELQFIYFQAIKSFLIVTAIVSDQGSYAHNSQRIPIERRVINRTHDLHLHTRKHIVVVVMNVSL